MSEFDDLMASSAITTPEQAPASQSSQPSGKWPGLIEPFIKGFLVRAPEYGAGGAISGLHEFVPGKLGDWFQNVGEAISDVAPQKLREEVEQTSSIPWFENDGDPWYSPLSWSPSRIPMVASKAMSMFGENVPLMLQTAATSWLGRKVVGAVAGAAGAFAAGGAADPLPVEEAAGGIFGALFADLVVPSVFMGLSEARNFAKQARDAGIEEDVAAKYARLYGPASGMIETMQSYASFGARVAGRTGKLVDPKAVKGMRYTLSKMLSMNGIKLPNEMEEGIEEVSQDFISNKLMAKAVEEMKARYGADWTPSKALPAYSFADAADSFAGGALIAGMMRGVGFTQRTLTGRVDADTEERSNALISKIAKGGETAVYESTAIENAAAIHEMVKKTPQKKGSLVSQADALNEQIDKINLTRTSDNQIARMDAAKIAALYESGDQVGAGNEWARQARVGVVLPDGMEADVIMQHLQDKQGKGITTMRDTRTNRSYIIAPDLVKSVEDAQKFSGMVKVEVNYEDRGNWVVDLDTSNPEVVAKALDIPYTKTKDGKVEVAPDDQKRLDDMMAGYEATGKSDLFTKNGGVIRVNYAGRAWITEEDLRKTGNTKILDNPKLTKREDGRILVNLSGSNRYEDGTKPVLEVFPGMNAFHLGEEHVELALKSKTAEGSALNLVGAGIYDRLAKMIKEEASRAQGSRKTLESATTVQEITNVLSGQIEELINTADHEALPPGLDQVTELRKAKGLKAQLEALSTIPNPTDMRELALNLQKQVRGMQTTYSKLTFADQMIDLNEWFKRADISDQTQKNSIKERIEILSKMWAMQQMGGSAHMSAGERQLVEFLHFTPDEAKSFEGGLRKILGDDVVKWMTTNRVPALAKEIPLAPEPVTKGRSFNLGQASKPVSETQVLVDTVKALVDEVKALKTQISGSPATNQPTGSSPVQPASSQAEAGSPPITPVVEAITPAVEPSMPLNPVETVNIPITENKPAVEAPSPVPVEVTDKTSRTVLDEIAARMYAQPEPVQVDDNGHNMTGSEDVATQIVNKTSTNDKASEPDEGTVKSQAVAGNASQKYDFEAKRYAPIFRVMRAMMGSASRTESALLKITKSQAFIGVVDENAKPEELTKHLEHNENDGLAERAFKATVGAWLKSGTESAAKGVLLLRSMQRFYSVYTPVPNVFYSLKGEKYQDLNSGDQVFMNRYNRGDELAKNLKARIAELKGNWTLLKEIREMAKAMPEENVENIEHRQQFIQMLSALYGFSPAMLSSITKQTVWDGLGKAFSRTRSIVKHAAPNSESWEKVISVMVKDLGEGRRNVNNISIFSGDAEGLALHGKDHADKPIVTAMVESPALVAVNLMAQERKESIDQIVRYVRGVKEDFGESSNWDEMDAYQRLCVELAEMRQYPGNMASVRVVPLGDKTDGFFLKYERFSGEAGLKKYAELYGKLDKKAQALFLTPAELKKEAGKNPTIRKDTIPADRYSELQITKAIANLDMYQRMYGNLGMYGFDQDKIMKRGSQVPSGGPVYKKPIKILFVKGIGGKMGDGAIFHTADFAKAFAAYFGSEYNPNVIKPYIRLQNETGKGPSFGIKSASYNIEMLKDIDAEAYKSILQMFAENPDVTHIVDDTSVKFSEDIEFGDFLDSSLRVKKGNDYSKSIVDVKEGSMFLVQNIDKTSDAVKGLLSRQMIYATSHMKHAPAREEIALKIMDAVYEQFREMKLTLDANGNPVDGSLAGKFLKEVLDNDQSEGLRKALLDNKESQESILNNSQVINVIFTHMRKIMEPQANVHSGVQVPAFDAPLPEFEKDDISGKNHLPWNKSNLKVMVGKDAKGKPIYKAPRKAMKHKSKNDALNYMNANPEKFLDLAEVNEDGLPIMENGLPKFSETSIRNVDGEFWTLGTVDWSARIPSESLLSAAPYRWMGPIQEGSDEGLALITEAGRKNNGADFDADSLFNATYFVDQDGNPFFVPKNPENKNEVIKALMNRRLRLLVADYEETDLKHLESGAETDIDELKKIMKDLAVEEKAKHKFKMNSSAFQEQAMNVFAAGMRMLGIAAKSNSANTVESLAGTYWNDTIKIGDLELSLTKERADWLASPEGLDERLYRSTVIGRAFINFLVDDASDPHAGYLFTYDTIPLALATLQGMKLSHATIKEDLAKVVKMLKSDIISGKDGYLDVLDTAKFSGEKVPALWKEMLEGTYGKDQANELKKLIDVSKARMLIGRLGAYAVAGKRPDGMARLDRFMSDVDEAHGQSIRGSFDSGEIYNPGKLKDSFTLKMAEKYVSRIREQTNKGINREIENVVRVVGKYKTAPVKGAIRLALQQAVAIKAIATPGLDVSGLPDAFQTLSEGYPEGHEARKFLDVIVKSGKTLAVAQSWKVNEFTDAQLKDAQTGWDNLKPEDQMKLAVYQFNQYGVTDSMFKGGYLPLIGPVWRKANDAKFSDASLVRNADVIAHGKRFAPKLGQEPIRGRRFFIPGGQVASTETFSDGAPIGEDSTEGHSLTAAEGAPVSFGFPWGATTGTIVDIATQRGICDATSAGAKRVMDERGFTNTKINDIEAESPIAGVGLITHRVASGIDSNGDEWILDQPQNEFISSGHAGSWEAASDPIHTSLLAGPFPSIVSMENMNPAIMFKSKKDVKKELKKNGFTDEYDIDIRMSVAGIVSDVQKVGDPQYPIYEGVLKGIRVRYDTNTEDLQFYNEETSRFTKDNFTPRFMPVNKRETIQQAYDRNIKAEAPVSQEPEMYFDTFSLEAVLTGLAPRISFSLQERQFPQKTADSIVRTIYSEIPRYPERAMANIEELLPYDDPAVTALRRMIVTDHGDMTQTEEEYTHSLQIGERARGFDSYPDTQRYMSPVNGKPRVEIPFRFDFNPEGRLALKYGSTVMLKDLINLQDEDLGEAYPYLMDNLSIKMRDWTATPNLLGSYRAPIGDDLAGTISIRKGLSENQVKSTLAHEIQHAIQDIEGTLVNTRVIREKQGTEAYRAHPIEKESRSSQARMDMTAEEIRQYPILADWENFSMSAVENMDTIRIMETGKYGVHRAYYTGHEELTARVTETAGQIEKWRKVIPQKNSALWEAITRYIDNPEKYKKVYDAWTSEQKKVVEEIKKFYDDQLFYFNESLRALSGDEWIKRRANYISRIYLAPQGGFKDRDLNTKHSERRMFKNIDEAENADYKLKITDAAELTLFYVHETTHMAQTRLMLVNAFAARDQAGFSQVIPIFHGEPNIRPSMKRLAIAGGNQSAGNMADVENAVHSNMGTWSAIKTALDKLTGRFDPEKQGYIKKESPFAEYAGFWVHPDSLAPMASILGERWDNKPVNVLLHVGAWSKFMTLGLSLFHHVAMAEATVAGLHGNAFKLQNGWRPRWAWNVDSEFKKQMEDPTFVGNAIRAGLRVSPYPNIDNGIITKDLDTAIAWAKDRNNKVALGTLTALKRYKGFMDLHLWTRFHASAKLYAFWFSYNERLNQLSKEGKDFDPDQLKRDIAQAINTGFGGLSWERWMFATPKVRQMLQMSLLAPDWTITNLNSMRGLLGSIPGMNLITGGLINKGLSVEARRWSLMKHWPGMITIMMMWPNVLQAMVYLAFKGNPDDHDEIFAAWNEEGKRFHIDMTPMYRKLGWISKDNLNERIYMKFAKQAWEVVDMAEEPLDKIVSKGNPIVKMAIEQVTGVDGIGRPLPFKGENFWTGLFSSEDGVVGSRAGTIVGKFIPMSILAWLGGKPPSWIAPTSKGMVKTKAIYAARDVLEAYADPSMWKRITGQDGYEKKLDTLIPEILEAAKRNGVNAKELMRAASASVRAKYYDKFWRAMNSGKEGDMIEASESLIRLHVGLDQFNESMKKKYSSIEGMPYSGEKRTLVAQYYRLARQTITPRERTARAIEAFNLKE